MMILPAKMEISRIVMWVKQCHKRPMIGNGNHTTYKDNDLGDGLWHCFTHIALTTSPVRPMMCNQVMCVNLAIERPHLLVLEFLSHLNFYLLIHDTYLRQYVIFAGLRCSWHRSSVEHAADVCSSGARKRQRGSMGLWSRVGSKKHTSS